MISIEFVPRLLIFGMWENINPLYPFMQNVSRDSCVRALVGLSIVTQIAPPLPWTPTRYFLELRDILLKKIVLSLLAWGVVGAREMTLWEAMQLAKIVNKFYQEIIHYPHPSSCYPKLCSCWNFSKSFSQCSKTPRKYFLL